MTRLQQREREHVAIPFGCDDTHNHIMLTRRVFADTYTGTGISYLISHIIILLLLLGHKFYEISASNAPCCQFDSKQNCNIIIRLVSQSMTS
jgi:hypothetical protein